MPFPNLARRSAWWSVVVLSMLVGLFSLRYALPTVPHPVLDNFVTHRAALVAHAVSASIALLLGPWQFVPGLRGRRPALHRASGHVYVAAVLFSWIASVPIALNAQTGMIASVGFLTLGVVWLYSTGAGAFFAVRRRIDVHRRWMVRSFALTASAVTLRILLGTGEALELPFDDIYPAIAWLCWVPNLIAAELILLARPDGTSKVGVEEAQRSTGSGKLVSRTRNQAA